MHDAGQTWSRRGLFQFRQIGSRRSNFFFPFIFQLNGILAIDLANSNLTKGHDEGIVRVDSFLQVGESCEFAQNHCTQDACVTLGFYRYMALFMNFLYVVYVLISLRESRAQRIEAPTAEPGSSFLLASFASRGSRVSAPQRQVGGSAGPPFLTPSVPGLCIFWGLDYFSLASLQEFICLAGFRVSTVRGLRSSHPGQPAER